MENDGSNEISKLVNHLNAEQLTRRDFLRTAINLGKGIGAGLIAQQLSVVGEAKAQVETERTSQIEVPPSIMLHARYKHEQLLPGLLSELNNQGYTGITYKNYLDSIKGSSNLPEKPIIISIDDLSMARGVPS